MDYELKFTGEQVDAILAKALRLGIKAGNDYGAYNGSGDSPFLEQLVERSGAAKVWHLQPNSIYVFYSVQWNGSDAENTGLGLYKSVWVEPSPMEGEGYDWKQDAAKVQGSKMYIVFTGERKEVDGHMPYLILYQSNKAEEYRMLKGYGHDGVGQLAVVSMGGTGDTKCADCVAINL